MITYGLLQALGLLKQKRWGDEELETDIKEIEQALEKNIEDLTLWDSFNPTNWSGVPPTSQTSFGKRTF